MNKLVILFLLVLLPQVFSLGEFLANCPANGNRADDPIVFPNTPGVSHMHTFFGSEGVNAYSTVYSMIHAPTSCGSKHDRSAYWIPSLLKIHNAQDMSEAHAAHTIMITNDDIISPDRATFYYHAFDYFSEVKPMPLGLTIIARKNYRFSCEGSPISGLNIVDCGSHKLELLINFPECWNGRDLDSPNHMDHMAYSIGNKCPTTHPVKLPRMQMKLRFPVSGGNNYMLSSGLPNTTHSDFVNGWVPKAMENRVNECLKLNKKCPEILDSDKNVPTEND